MDLTFLLNYMNPLILGLCLTAGFALKEAFDKFPNKYIPLTALGMGTAIAIILHRNSGIDAEVILSGMISGLASTGLYELLRNLIHRTKEESEEP